MNFCNDKRGNVGMLFGVALLPLSLAIGAATDFASLQKVRSEVQNAFDTSLLSAAVRNDFSSDNLQTSLQSAYKNSPTSDAGSGIAFSSVTVANLSQTTTETTYEGTATLTLTTPFLALFSMPAIVMTVRSDVAVQKKIATVSFVLNSVQDVWSKDIFFFTRDANGALMGQQTVLTYRYSQAGSVMTPALGSSTLNFSVPDYAVFGVGMTVYRDATNNGALVNATAFYSDVNAAQFVRQTGACSDPGGARFNLEDGGDADFLDAVFAMTCTLVQGSGQSARLVR